MKLLFIHGPPGAGKLTTAKALLGRVPGRLFDNHAAIDVARTVYDFGAPGFWELVREVRLSVLESAGRTNVALVVMTFVYVPEDLVIFQQFEACVKKHDGELLPVFLDCAVDELARRIDNPDRVARKKLTSAESLRATMAEDKIEPVPRACLMLNSEATDANANALAIIRHFSLDSSIA